MAVSDNDVNVDSLAKKLRKFSGNRDGYKFGFVRGQD